MMKFTSFDHKSEESVTRHYSLRTLHSKWVSPDHLPRLYGPWVYDYRFSPETADRKTAHERFLRYLEKHDNQWMYGQKIHILSISSAYLMVSALDSSSSLELVSHLAIRATWYSFLSSLIWKIQGYIREFRLFASYLTYCLFTRAASFQLF